MANLFTRFALLSLSGALVAAAVFAVSRLFGRALSASWRYYVWLLVLLRLVIPFAPGVNLVDRLHQAVIALPSAQPAVQAPAARGAATQHPEHVADTAPVPGRLTASNAAQPSLSPARTGENPMDTAGPVFPQNGPLQTLRPHAWALWLGVALALLARMITGYHGFARRIRAGCKAVDDPAALNALGEVCALYGQKKPLPLYVNRLVTSPMLLGMLRPVIVLPGIEPDPARMRHILAHEITHHRRRDILFKWFLQTVCCLHWFNPMIYLVRNEIRIACELSCDEAVLRHIGAAHRLGYGDTLLAVLAHGGRHGDSAASVTMSEEGRIMKKRLQSIAAPHKRSAPTVLVSALLSALLLAGAAFAGAYTGEAAQRDASDAAHEQAQPVDTRGYQDAFAAFPARAESYAYLPDLIASLPDSLEDRSVRRFGADLLAAVFSPPPAELSDHFAAAHTRAAWNMVGTYLTMALTDEITTPADAADSAEDAAGRVSGTINEVLSKYQYLDEVIADALRAVGQSARHASGTAQADPHENATPPEMALDTALRILAAADTSPETAPFDPALLRAVQASLPVQSDEPQEARILRALYAATEYEEAKLSALLETLEDDAQVAEVDAVQDAYLDYLFAAAKLHQVAYAIGGAQAQTVVDHWGVEIQRLNAVRDAYDAAIQ